MNTFRHVLVATDFAESSQRALDFALALANRLRAKLTLVHAAEIPAYAYEAFVYPTAEVVNALNASARRQLNTLLASVQKTLPDADAILRHGAAWQQILSTAEQTRADLIVIGTHGRTGASRALLGSVAERVVRLSPVPVMVVH